ncbi:MAG: heme biosynthesis HemY N-terminal domain-containing protein [Pseudomonadota bacterium]|nr:heme biosynthesis HemY N-terminal domain-containing protein [Pseudomonadota bacterium]
MKLAFFLFVSLFLGAITAHYFMQENGYVLINFQGYEIQMSVPVMIFLLFSIYITIRILVHAWHSPRRLGEYVLERRSHKAGERITKGYIELGEGNFARSEKLLTRGVRHSDTPLLNYLAAARAAQALGDKSRRDSWLNMAQEQEPDADIAILLARAELQLDNQEEHEANVTLCKILEKSPDNLQAMYMLADILFQKKNWNELEELLPKLQRYAYGKKEKLDHWTTQTWGELLKNYSFGSEAHKKLIKKLPRHLHNDIRILKAQAETLIISGQNENAEAIIRKALDRSWDEELIRLYGFIELSSGEKPLEQIEIWLSKRPKDSVLLLTAGRICVQNKLWGKARSYFEASLGINSTPEVWHELGRLFNSIGEKESAYAAYQKGLTLSYSSPKLSASNSKVGQSSD